MLHFYIIYQFPPQDSRSGEILQSIQVDMTNILVMRHSSDPVIIISEEGFPAAGTLPAEVNTA